PQPTPGPYRGINLASDGLLTLIGLSLVTVSSRTERIRREAQAARAAAVAALQAQDGFLSVAAHELKTPMASAKVAAELLLQRYAQPTTPDPVQMQRALRTIDLQIDKLSQRVIELLESVRLRAGRFTLNPTQT